MGASKATAPSSSEKEAPPAAADAATANGSKGESAGGDAPSAKTAAEEDAKSAAEATRAEFASKVGNTSAVNNPDERVLSFSGFYPMLASNDPL